MKKANYAILGVAALILAMVVLLSLAGGPQAIMGSLMGARAVPDGLDTAEITVDGGMPQHGHGLPTKPQVTQNLGQGDYLVEGLKFNMPGWWEVTFHITSNGQSDSVTFNPILK